VGSALEAGEVYTASGTDTYTVNIPVTGLYSGSATYASGDQFTIIFTNANTGTTPTININSEGVVTIVDNKGDAVAAGDVEGILKLAYDGTNFRIVGGTGSGTGGTVTDVTGTTNRITSTGGTTPQIDISATFEALLGKVAQRIDQNNAATTSAQLASVITDETGTGALVFAGGNIGAGTATTAAAGTSTTQIATTAFVQNEIAFSFVSVTGAVTLDNTAFGKMHLCSGTSTNYTIALPTAVGNANKSIGFKGVDGLTRTVTIDGNSGDQIDGEDSREFTAGGLFVVLSDGTNWHVVAEVGSWVPFTPVWTGVSADPTVAEAKYFRLGKQCTVKIRCSGNGTSNATTKTVTMPFNASTIAQFGLGHIIMNNTTTQTTPGFIITRANNNVLDLYRDSNSTAWTATGGFRFSFTATFEIE
jgi:hypothetical protein